LAVDDYKLKLKTFREQTMAWKENKAKCYYLVLFHCPKELEQELRNSTRWSETEDDQDVVALLEMIRDVTHNKKERKESVMTIVESDVELFTIVQESGQSLDDYYKIYKAQVDTIDAHGGNAGHHPVVYHLHLANLLTSRGITKEEYNAMTGEQTADKMAIQSEAMKTSKEAYLACLFLLMADEERYGGVKATLDDNYLLGKQEYPQNLLAAKRLLADFNGTGPKGTQKVGAAGEQGVAFVAGGGDSSPPAMAAARSARAAGGSAATSPRGTEPRSRNWTPPGTSRRSPASPATTTTKPSQSTSPRVTTTTRTTGATTRPPRQQRATLPVIPSHPTVTYSGSRGASAPTLGCGKRMALFMEKKVAGMATF
jgi:hypothetical protein